MIFAGLAPENQYKKVSLKNILNKESEPPYARFKAVPGILGSCGDDCKVLGELKEVPEAYEKAESLGSLIEFSFCANGLNHKVLKALKDYSERNQPVFLEGLFLPEYKSLARGPLFRVDTINTGEGSYSGTSNSRLRHTSSYKDRSIERLLLEDEAALARIKAVPRGSSLCEDDTVIKGYFQEPVPELSTTEQLENSKALKGLRFTCNAYGSQHELSRFLKAGSEARLPFEVRGSIQPKFNSPEERIFTMTMVSYGSIYFDYRTFF
ncbi:MAG TPA: hypothetical protein ENN46_01325 [Candidatus Woesearchaeota archaeon]|nr:hypothetical protein [Candidatus Woesearchaeota archaeon]